MLENQLSEKQQILVDRTDIYLKEQYSAFGNTISNNNVIEVMKANNLDLIGIASSSLRLTVSFLDLKFTKEEHEAVEALLTSLNDMIKENVEYEKCLVLLALSASDLVCSSRVASIIEEESKKEVVNNTETTTTKL